MLVFNVLIKIKQGLYVSQPTYKANNNIIRQLGCNIRIFIQLYGGWLVYMKIYILYISSQALYKNKLYVIWQLAVILCILERRI